MIAGYVKFGKLDDALKLFDVMPDRNVVSWNTMIVGLAKSDMCSEAVGLYVRLRGLGLGFSRYSFAGVLIACGKMGEVGLVRQVHGQVLVEGFSLNVVLASSIVDGYAKCGAIEDARRLFDELRVRDVTCWTCMLSGYAKNGGLDAAWELFEDMPVKNSVSWTALIAGHVEHGRVPRALELFAKMVELGFEPDQFTFSSILCACAGLGFIRHGKQIHATLIRTGFVPNAIVWSSLVDMYSKCGCLEAARLVFRCTTSKHNLVLWNTMISALAQHGQGREAIQLYTKMVRLGIKPDDTTFIVVLQACYISSLTEEGRKIFDSMETFGVTPSKELYACLEDVLGQKGLLEEMETILHSMQCKSDARIWSTFLEWCRLYRNVKLENKAANRLLELEPSFAFNGALTNVDAELELQDSTRGLRQLKNEGKTKVYEISWIEVERKMHSFIVQDQLHPMTVEIYEILGHLAATRMDGISSV